MRKLRRVVRVLFPKDEEMKEPRSSYTAGLVYFGWLCALTLIIGVVIAIILNPNHGQDNASLTPAVTHQMIAESSGLILSGPAV